MNPKIPTTQFPVNDIIRHRWSARSFSETRVTPEDLNTLMEAATWASSSMNEQPWHYLYAFRGELAFEKMHGCLLTGNQPWAINGGAMLISLAKRHFDRNGQINRHAMHDVGAANTTLLLQAASMGILGHMMGGFDYQKTLEVFDLDPDQWEIACFIVVGYPDAPERLEEPFKTREMTARSRKAINEISRHAK